ncbi:hypothetical protein [Oceanobacillus senegalensis]|nr:hypothetical protein [Oceanobacillus senegalensis]
MKKVLFALFVMLILTVGTVGVVKTTDDPVKIIEDNNISTEISF